MVTILFGSQDIRPPLMRALMVHDQHFPSPASGILLPGVTAQLRPFFVGEIVALDAIIVLVGLRFI